MTWLKYKFDISLRLNDYNFFVVKEKKSNIFLTFDFGIYAIFGRCGPRNFPRKLSRFVSGSYW
jgi:hypothetical protein